MTLCRHCDREVADRPRGLCRRCYHKDAIRRLYPRERNSEADEPTEAELERTIEEQMANLPDWWEVETLAVIEGRDEE